MTTEPVEALIARGEQQGYLPLSEVELVAGEADSEEREALYADLDESQIEVRDDYGREKPGEVTYSNGDLASATSDSLQLFLNEMSRYPLLTAREEVELAKRIERGDRQGKDRVVNSHPRPVAPLRSGSARSSGYGTGSTETHSALLRSQSGSGSNESGYSRSNPRRSNGSRSSANSRSSMNPLPDLTRGTAH